MSRLESFLKSAIVYHAPHTSTYSPPRYRATLKLDDEALRRELNRLTDHRIDDLLVPSSLERRLLRAPISRIVMDMERYPDDALEPAARVGMGMIYTRTSTGAVLRDPPSPVEREELLGAYYRPHHQRLHALTTEALDRVGAALILDLHSFPSEPLPTELPTTTIRPDICIGTDNFHTPPKLVNHLRGALERAGLRVAIDDPFSGTMVPSAYYGSDARVYSVMIEVNRRLYLDDSETAASVDFPRVGATLRACVAEALGGFAASVVW